MSKKTEFIGFRVTEDCRQALEKRAADLGISLSSLLCLALTQYLKETISTSVICEHPMN